MSAFATSAGSAGHPRLFLRRFRLSTQLALIGALALLPLLWFAALWWQDKTAQLAFASNELAGARAATAVLDVAVQTQVHRGQTNLLLSGNAAMGEKLPATRQRLAEALKQADALLAGQPAWGLVPAWQPVHAALTNLARGNQPGDRAATFAAHTAQVKALHGLMQQVGDRSQLLFDPEAASYYMAEMSVERLLPWSETVGLMRGQGAGLLSRGEASADEINAIHGRMALLQEQIEGMRAKTAAMARGGIAPPPAFAEAQDRSTAFIALARQSFGTGQPQGDATAFFTAGTQAIEAVVACQRALGTMLEQSMQHRAGQIARERLVFTLLGAGCMAALVLVGVLFLRHINRVLHTVGRSMQAVAEGDMSLAVHADGRDEFATMAEQVNRMRLGLSTVVRSIQAHADEVARSGDTLMSDSRELATRTSQQAASVEESAATLEQVALTVRTNGDHLLQVAGLFEEVRQTVDVGSQSMRAAVTTVQGIESTSQRVADIVSVIDGIAFQTNILALNAAVEAARAGESGRGFAVVAAEVRSLAQRCSTAAGEVRSLIAASAEQVAQGAGEIRGASDSLDALRTKVDRVHGDLQSLSSATREQTDAVELVTEAVRQMGMATQGNAASVERASALADALESQARALMDTVARMKPAATPDGPTVTNAHLPAPRAIPAPA